MAQKKPKPLKSKKSLASASATTQPAAQLTPDEAYQVAEQAFKAGQHAQAKQLCQQILGAAPRHALALHLLGVIMAHAGHLKNAEQLMVRALQFQPEDSNFQNSLANVYRLLNKPELAALHLKKAEGRRDYSDWVEQFDTLKEETIQVMRTQMAQWQSPPQISILMPTYNTKAEWLRAVLDSVINQVYPHWELCVADDASTMPQVRQILEEYAQKDSRIKLYFRLVNGHISAASNSALALATGDYVALLDHDDVLTPHALYFVAGEIITHPDVRLLYSDEDKINEMGERFEPYFKCDWNPDLFLSHNFLAHLIVYKTVLLREVGGFREGYEGAQDYDLALRVIERLKPQHIRHIPHILYHWRSHSGSTSLNINAKTYAVDAAIKAVREYLERGGKIVQVSESLHAPGMLRVRYVLSSSPSISFSFPLVSLIIPTRNKVELLRVCIGSILEKTDYKNFEIIVVDNHSDDPDTLAYLEQLQTKSQARVLSYPHPFNYSAINNFAVEQARGELICLLNNDMEVINHDWLTEMVSHAVRSDIGAVGARLWYGNNTLQHGGIIVGIGGVASHNHKHLPRGQAGYFGRAQLLQNLSAVTGACLLLRKEVFTAVGGLNSTELAIAFNDVDLCLKIREQLGLRMVWTPYAELYHYESVSRGYEDTPEKRARFSSEVMYMKKRWGDDLLLNDPAYSPNLTLDHENFAIAWPPRVQIHETAKKYSQPSTFQWRQPGYQLLQGQGLEIGALMNPAQVPYRCLVDYCDAHSKQESLKLFPELQTDVVEVDHICDLDKQRLSLFQNGQFDFVILNHLIEHVANPIRVIEEVFRVTKIGGHIVISAPDKNFTFDKDRSLTSFEHLLTEYEEDVTAVTDDHYLDFLVHVHPECNIAMLPPQDQQIHIKSVKNRREYAHVWNSQTFSDFLKKSLELLNLQATCVFEITGENNRFEYFSVWRKEESNLPSNHD